MEKPVLVSFRSFYRNWSFLLFVSLLIWCSLFIGCAASTKRYDKIPYCWTSDHHLYPDERILTLNLSQESTADGIIKWVNEKGGKIIENNNNCSTVAKLQPDSKKNFLAVQNIVKKEWNAYDENKYRKWEEGEWEKLQQLSKSQINFTNPHDKHGYCLKTKLGRREYTIEYLVQVGTVTTMQPTYIYTKSGPMFAGMIPVHNPQMETRKKTNLFFSQIDFFIFSDQESTKIYAVGVPLEESSPVKVGCDATIGHSWWPTVTGKDEALLIKEAYAYLKNLEFQP